MVKIKVYVDLVCPYCFFAEQIIERISEEKGNEMDVEWMPYELRPYPTPTLKPEGDYLSKVWDSSVLPMAKQLGIKIILPEISPQPYTELAFEGFQFAKEKGLEKEYLSGVFKSFFQLGLDIGNVIILTEVITDIGLDAVDFRIAMEERKYKQAHQNALKHAYQEMDIKAVPSFLIGNKFIPGLVREEGLLKIIEKQIIEDTK